MNTLNIIILIISLLTVLIGLLVLKKNYKNPSNVWYFLMCFFGGAWGIMKAIQFSVMDVYWHDILISRLVMFFGTMAPLAYFMLTYYFVYKIKTLSKARLFIIFLIAGALGLLYLFGILGHAEVTIVNNALHRNIIFWDFLIFAVYFFTYIFFGFIILLKKYFVSEGISKDQIRYLMVATVGNFLTTGIVSVVLLLFNNFDYDWLGAIFLLINLFVVGYLIFIRPIKH